MTQNDSVPIRYSIGTGLSFGKAKNQTHTWKQFKDRFRKPLITPERFSQYLNLSNKQQIELKALPGWFYRTQVSGKRRNRRSGLPTDVITLDFDYANQVHLEMIRQGLVLPGVEHFVHSTRRHTPEKPRLRMVIPVAEPIPNDYYPAVSRILAQQIDPDMEMVDPVSFRVAQMMFMPTISSDSEYVFEETSGDLFDWKEALNEYKRTVGDWRDITNLPKCAGEKLRKTADKAEDPTTKVGPVGDFCRAYTIQEAIDAFDLPYEESTDADRYTYTGGTTSNGMEVYDDGLFAYSHHGSDPASDMLVNAFDLVRIHLFSELDEETDDETPMGQRPSWKAMIERLTDDPGYKRAVVDSHYDRLAMFDDLLESDPDEDQPVEHHMNGSVVDPEIEELIGTPKIMLPTKAKGAPVDDDWFSKLQINPRTGEIESNLPNIALILQNDLRLRGLIELNQFTHRRVTRRKLKSWLSILADTSISDRASGDPIEDGFYGSLRCILESPNGKGKVGYGLRVTKMDLWDAVEQTAKHWHFHPVRDALSGFEWDGVERLETFLIRYLGVEDNPYHREIAVKWFLGAVTRAFEPGHKFDFAIILEGAQGKRKSTMIEILSLGWFGELHASFHDEKRLVEQMMGRWIMELPELSNFNRSSVEDMKAFIAATENHVRTAYARETTLFKRQCVFMGSTNKRTYLLDDTGNRRFWPVEVMVDQIDTDALRHEIGQIWAEAVDIYRRLRAERPVGDLPLHLTNIELQAYAAQMQELRRQETEADSYVEAIEVWLDTPYPPDEMDPETTILRDRCTNLQLWQNALEMNGFPNRAATIEIGKAMRYLGWEYVVIRERGEAKVTKGWRPVSLNRRIHLNPQNIPNFPQNTRIP